MMRKSRTRCMSLLLAFSLVLSLSAPGNYNFVQAEGSNGEPTTENSTQTEEKESYSIVFFNDEDKELEESSATIDYNENTTLQLNPRLKDSNGNYIESAEFNYTSSDETVATVSDTGLVTAQALPEDKKVEITVTWNNKDSESSVVATFNISVSAIKVQSVTLEEERKTLVIGDTYVLNTTVLPAEALQEVTYTSETPEVATISANGTVTAIAEGTTTITATAKNDPALTDTIEITVIDVPVSIEFEQSAYSVRETEQLNLKAQLVYSSGKKISIDNSQLKFTSTDEAIATVDQTGTVTAGNLDTFPQTVTIHATYSVSYERNGTMVTEVSGNCQISVVAIPVSGIRLDNSETSITLKIGETYQLKPVILPSNASLQDVTYTSSKTSVASVGKAGKITAKGIGETVITVASKENPDIKVTFNVKVYQTTFNLGELKINGTDKKSDRTAINKILKYATLIDETIQVIVPAGTYYINGSLTIYSDTNLILEKGAVIKRFQSSGGSHMLVSSVNEKVKGYNQCKNITISGGTWDGNTTGTKSANCIYIGHAQNVTIRDTVIRNNSGSHLLELAGVNNALVENVELYGYTMCTASNYTASQADKEAIQLDYCGSVSTPLMKPYDLTPCKNITIRNCDIHDYMSGIGTHTAVSGVYLSNIKIEKNTFTNITNACINLRNFKKVTINKNKASGFTTFLYANNSTGTVKSNTIKNKSFTKKTKSGLRAANGITISNSSNFTIQSNTIQSTTSNGICVWEKSTATIKSNKLKKNGLYGIRTSASTITLSKNTLSGNKKGCYDTYSTATVKSSDDIRSYYVNLKSTYKYTGKAIKPKITIKNLNKKYYKVSYKKNKKVGTATVTIKGKGKVKKTLKLTFKIVKK